MASEKRVAKHWDYNPALDVEAFNLDEVNEKNFINHLLKLKETDVSYTFMMNIFGSFNGKSFCHQYDTFDVPVGAFKFVNKKGKEVSNKNKFTTTIGIWIFNVFFIRDFGFSKLVDGYINRNINKDEFEDFNQLLIYALMEDKIDTQTYKKYLNYTQFFMPFESILSVNHTEKILGCSKVIEKKKKELLKEYGDRIEAGDVVASEKMEKELLDFAKDYLKDDPSYDAYEGKALGSFKNNFKNMYVMKGAIKDPDPYTKKPYNIMTSNYIDGVDAQEYSLFANSLSAGPYGRSKKTQIGGYWEKLFGAAFQTVIAGPAGSDCGTDRYIEVELTKKNLQMYMYNYIIKSNGELEELTSDNCDKYIGKRVKMRFVIFCKMKNCRCNKCLGNAFYRRGSKNIGLATQQIPSTLKVRSLKLFHDSTVGTSEIDPMKAFGLRK
jgi:hypothetical protein